jgi:hypothetical protein
MVPEFATVEKECRGKLNLLRAGFIFSRRYGTSPNMFIAGAWLGGLALLYTALRELSWTRDPFLRLINDPLVWGPVGALLGIYGFVRGFSLLKRKRLVMNTPRSTVRAAALGAVEISGRAAGPYTLVSPICNSDCYYYRLVATLLEDKRKKTCSIEQCAPLFLNDGTGDVMVDPQGAEIQFPALASEQAGSLPEYLCHFLLQHGISSDAVATVEEFCIRPGDQIVVFGTLQENPWFKSAKRDGAARIGPGFLSEAAADVQRRRAFPSLNPNAPSGDMAASARTFDLYPPVLLAKGPAPFFISNCSQRDLTESLALKSALYIWGGPVVALFSAYFLLQRVAGLWPR